MPLLFEAIELVRAFARPGFHQISIESTIDHMGLSLQGPYGKQTAEITQHSYFFSCFHQKGTSWLGGIYETSCSARFGVSRNSFAEPARTMTWSFWAASSSKNATTSSFFAAQSVSMQR